MSGVWWGRESSTALRTPQPPRRAGTPLLMPSDRASLLAEFDGRADAFTPEWTNRNPAEDAGTALRQLFGEQLEAVVQRFDRWPDKALVEYLDVAGVSPLPGVPAEVLLEFEVANDAPQSVLVAPGFQVGARPPGATGLVIFETERTLYAAPSKIGEVFATSGRIFDQVDLSNPFFPFGDGRSSGAAMLIGLIGDNPPSQTITIGIGIQQAAGAPPPVSAGGVAPLPVPSGPALTWELFDGGSPVALEVVRDETGGLIRSGLVELALPARWRPGGPAGLPKVKSQRWLRLRLAYGRFTASPKLSFVRINVARALGARTVRDEICEPVPNSNGRRMRVSQTPVVAGSLRLEIDDSGLELGPSAGATPVDGAQSEQGATLWTEVADLSAYGPDDAVYVIDNASGEITFGDGHHGRAPPDGFRNVRAASYRVMSQAPAQIDAGAITSALTSVQYLGKVSNPLPTEGGGPAETIPEVVKRGPQEIRARGRAVTVADYALLALRAEGALVARAFAVAGLHPQYPGRPIAGVVGVFVVPPDRGQGKPTPDPEMLRAVANYLAQHAAPAGVEVVAAAPRYHNVMLDIGLVLEPGVDASATLRSVLQAIDVYLHPITGGEAGDGWTFGGSIRYVPLLRLISRIDGVSAVKKLNVVLDGLRAPACQDVPLSPYSLLWPGGHQIVLLDQGSTP